MFAQHHHEPDQCPVSSHAAEDTPQQWIEVLLYLGRLSPEHVCAPGICIKNKTLYQRKHRCFGHTLCQFLSVT